MDGDINFKPVEAVKPSVAEPVKTISHEPHTQDTPIEAPFTSYSVDNHKPFTVDYFQLGENWNEFEEVPQIENYFRQLIEAGKMDNTVKAVKTKLSQIEKMSNIDKTERTVVKVGKLAAYIRFLQDTEHLDREVLKYGQ